MKKQLHNRLSDNFVKEIFDKYEQGQISFSQLSEILKVKKTRVSELLKKYREDKENFTIIPNKDYNSRLEKKLEQIIKKELQKDKELIQNPDIPIKKYNYSYLRRLLQEEYHFSVSVPTIIKRAKSLGYHKSRKKYNTHTREVLTNYPGELIQHDSSYHLFAPLAKEKWYLITSLDDFTRLLMYAKLFKKETSWAHILALKSLIMQFGIPLKYYTDNHSIFRFVQGRDSIWREHLKVTDDITTQFKQILDAFDISITYALSAQAKGKIERPYSWIQDHLVRSCVRKNIKDINKAQLILDKMVYQYNYTKVHTSTKQIPYERLQEALNHNQTFFRPFELPEPYKNENDIFSLKWERVVDKYNSILIKNKRIKLNGVSYKQKVRLHIVPDMKKGIAEVRIWSNYKLLDVISLKISDLGLVRF